MRALPDLADSELMATKGRQSALGTARNQTMQELRDAYTFLQSCQWDELRTHADKVVEVAERLKTLAALWDEFA